MAPPARRPLLAMLSQMHRAHAIQHTTVHTKHCFPASDNTCAAHARCVLPRTNGRLSHVWAMPLALALALCCAHRALAAARTAWPTPCLVPPARANLQLPAIVDGRGASETACTGARRAARICLSLLAVHKPPPAACCVVFGPGLSCL